MTILTDSPFHKPQLQLDDRLKKRAVEKILTKLCLTHENICKIREVFESEMRLGLARNSYRPSSLQMENTFIPKLPDGTENGDFLALDLGGTNFRVILLSLRPGQEGDFLVKYYSVPEHLRMGPGEQLFDFLASCIYHFLESNELLGNYYPLGFTFSFPMIQKALDVGILLTWTKSFNCSGVVGQDAVKMLNDAIARKGNMNVDVVAVLNDTTGTLVKGAYTDPDTAIGLILGTGSNACYLERIDRIEKWDKPGVTEVIIDIEWGAFGDNGVLDFIKTDFDRAVDCNSLLVHSFTFEKLFAGKYMGELVRHILIKLCREGLLFGGAPSETLLTFGSFTTADVSGIEGDNDDGENTRKILRRLGFAYPYTDDMLIVRHVCAVVTVRGARVVATCLSSLLDRMVKPEVTIAVDGSLFKHHPKFQRLMNDFIGDMLPEQKFKLMLAEDGSGKGAGLVAAVALKLREDSKKLIAKDNL